MNEGSLTNQCQNVTLKEVKQDKVYLQVWMIECCSRTYTYAEEDGQFGNEIRGGTMTTARAERGKVTRQGRSSVRLAI